MWQQHMRIGLNTEVSIYHSVRNFPEQEFVAVFLSHLQKECATRCCELWISGHQNMGGQVETTVLTTMELATVSALIANVQSHYSASTAVAIAVKPPAPGSINNVMKPPFISRA